MALEKIHMELKLSTFLNKVNAAHLLAKHDRTLQQMYLKNMYLKFKQAVKVNPWF